MKTANLGIAFLLELCMLGALAYWGVQAGGSTVIKIILAIGAPLLAAIIWGLIMAPQSPRRLTGVPYLVVKIVIFGIAIIALVWAGQVMLAIIFAVVTVLNQILLLAWHQDTPPLTN